MKKNKMQERKWERQSGSLYDRQGDRNVVVAMRRPYRAVMAMVMLPGILFSDLISSPRQS